MQTNQPRTEQPGLQGGQQHPAAPPSLASDKAAPAPAVSSSAPAHYTQQSAQQYAPPPADASATSALPPQSVPQTTQQVMPLKIHVFWGGANSN